MKIGDQIRYFRKTKNISQYKLAEGICSVSYLSKIENNQTKASDEIISFLTKRLGFDICLDNKDEKHISELNDWLFSMFNRNKIKAEHYYKNLLKEKIKNSEKQIFFKIMETLYHLLFEVRIDYIKSNLVQLSKVSGVMKNDNLFYFYLVKGLYYYYIKKYQDSYNYLKKSEALMFDAHLKVEQWLRGYLFYLIGLVARSLWKNMICLDYTKTALKEFEDIYELKRCADCRILLGIIYQRIDNYDEAVKHLNMASTIADAYNDNVIRGIVFQNLGYIESKRNKSKLAIKLYQKSLAYKKDQPSAFQVSTIYTLIEEYFKTGEKQKGFRLVEKGLSLVKENDGLKDYYFHFHFYYLAFQFGLDHEKTVNFLTLEAIPYFQSNNKWIHLPEYIQIATNYYEKQLKYKIANDYYKLYIKALKKINQEGD